MKQIHHLETWQDAACRTSMRWGGGPGGVKPFMNKHESLFITSCTNVTHCPCPCWPMNAAQDKPGDPRAHPAHSHWPSQHGRSTQQLVMGIFGRRTSIPSCRQGGIKPHLAQLGAMCDCEPGFFGAGGYSVLGQKSVPSRTRDDAQRLSWHIVSVLSNCKGGKRLPEAVWRIGAAKSGARQCRCRSGHAHAHGFCRGPAHAHGL